uniref:Uncharacterized protein n=1 Tax=Parascaris univalens TaxID=6257 RepID=A0A914ZNL7_PARUN
TSCCPTVLVNRSMLWLTESVSTVGYCSPTLRIIYKQQQTRTGCTNRAFDKRDQSLPRNHLLSHIGL